MNHPKLTLDQAWDICLKLWTEVVRDIDEGSRLSVVRLKQNHLPAQFRYCALGCPFCQFTDERRKPGDTNCQHCPARLVDPTFMCHSKLYGYNVDARLFLAKLQELDAKRDKPWTSTYGWKVMQRTWRY